MCIEWAKKYVKRLEWYDISLIKSATFFFALFLVTAWPAFLDFVMSFEWGWYLGIALLCSVSAFRKMF